MQIGTTMGSPEAGPDPFEEEDHDADDESHGPELFPIDRVRWSVSKFIARRYS